MNNHIHDPVIEEAELPDSVMVRKYYVCSTCEEILPGWPEIEIAEMLDDDALMAELGK